MDGTLGLVLKASSRQEGSRTFVTVRRLSCDSEQGVKRVTGMEQLDSKMRLHILPKRFLRDEHNGSKACNDANSCPTL